MLRILKWLLPVALGLVLWRVFFPAIMNYDAIVQFRQAWEGRYTDWHPPLMALVLHLFLKAGRNVGALVLVQCLAGLFGVLALARAWLRAFFGPAPPAPRADAIALLVLLGLLLPLTPLALYLVTFWKDSWSAVILVWMCAVACRLVTEPAAGRGERLPWAWVAALLALSTALSLVRHNAIFILPCAGLVLWMAARRTARGVALALAAAPLLAFAVSEAAINRIFDVEKVHLERHMMAFDLVGICALDTQACDSLPYIRSFLRVPDYRQRYVPGDMGSSFWTAPPMLDPAALWNGYLLRAEYLKAARQHPGLLLRVKLEAFVPLLGLHGPPHLYFYSPEIQANEYGLKMNPRFAAVREELAGLTRTAGDSPVLRFVSGVHLVWILVNGIWIAVLLASPGRRPLAVVMLLPLGFYLSYLPATPAGDYRFMYPATLALQVITLAWAVQTVAVWASGWRTARS